MCEEAEQYWQVPQRLTEAGMLKFRHREVPENRRIPPPPLWPSIFFTQTVLHIFYSPNESNR